MLRGARSSSGHKRGSGNPRTDLLIVPDDRYSAPVFLRNQQLLRNRCGIGLQVLFAAAFALASGGCSLTMHLASLQVDPETTATVQPAASPLDSSLDQEDWRRAKAALSLAVDPQGSGQQVNWDNPATKRKGSFSAAGNLVLIENTVCRPFTATIVQMDQGVPPREVKHTGQACRVGPGDWAMRQMLPTAPETTAKIRANSLLPAPELKQGLPSPTTSILDAE